jgi:protein AroM
MAALSASSVRASARRKCALNVEAGSPYENLAGLERAVERLQAWGAELVVLDCIGFTAAMKERAAAIAGVPVVLARTLAELL